MKIGVIGSINRDTVLLADKTLKQGWGGILYNLITLSHLIGKRAEIFPVCNIGRDCGNEINGILRQLPGVRVDYIHEVPARNNHCYLTYSADGEKTEILKGGVPPLRFDDVAPLLDSDMILINYISGRDIYLKSLQKLRKLYAGPIFMDIHSATLGKRPNGARFFRRPPYWQKMIKAADYIQMNRRELAILNGRREWPLSPKIRLIDECSLLFRHLNSAGVTISNKAFIVTTGIDGCHIARPGDGRLMLKHITPSKPIKDGDTTGCGDCFNAGMVAELAKGASIYNSAVKGNEVAGRRVAGSPLYIKLSLKPD
jgi:sugar/nucleoside kinase (ribokinase family)